MITAGKAERYIKLILFFACAIPMFFYIDGFISIGGFGFIRTQENTPASKL